MTSSPHAGALLGAATTADADLSIQDPVLLRAEQKPRIFAELERLYAQLPAAVEVADESCATANPSTKRIEELEAELQRIDLVLLSKLDPTALGSERSRAGAQVLERTEARVRGRAELLYVPSNFDCVHGPLATQVVAGFAEELVAVGESLSELLELRFRRPIRRHVTVDVERHESGANDGEGAKSFAEAVRRSALSGTFGTSRGALLRFVVTEQPGAAFVTEQANDNQIAQRLLAGARAHVDAQIDCVRLPLSVSELTSSQREALRAPRVMLGTLLDLVPILILNLNSGVPMLAYACSDVPLPEELPPGAELQIRRCPERQTASVRGLSLVPYEFRFYPAHTEWAVWTMAQASNGVAEMLRVLHTTRSRGR